MMPHEVAELVNRLISTWPLGPKGYVWTNELTKLTDYDRARTTVELLTMSEHAPPSVAKLLEVYRSLGRPAGWDRPEDTGPPIAGADYRAGLEARAAAGDDDAITQLANWARLRRERAAASVERHPSALVAEDAAP